MFFLSINITRSIRTFHNLGIPSQNNNKKKYLLNEILVADVPMSVRVNNDHFHVGESCGSWVCAVG